VIARAARLYGVGVVDFEILSNHASSAAGSRRCSVLAKFTGYVDGNIAKEAGRFHAWKERFWGRRYRGIVVSDIPSARSGWGLFSGVLLPPP